MAQIYAYSIFPTRCTNKTGLNCITDPNILTNAIKIFSLRLYQKTLVFRSECRVNKFGVNKFTISMIDFYNALSLVINTLADLSIAWAGDKTRQDPLPIQAQTLINTIYLVSYCLSRTGRWWQDVIQCCWTHVKQWKNIYEVLIWFPWIKSYFQFPFVFVCDPGDGQFDLVKIFRKFETCQKDCLG